MTIQFRVSSNQRDLYQSNARGSTRGASTSLNLFGGKFYQGGGGTSEKKRTVWDRDHHSSGQRPQQKKGCWRSIVSMFFTPLESYQFTKRTGGPKRRNSQSDMQSGSALNMSTTMQHSHSHELSTSSCCFDQYPTKENPAICRYHHRLPRMNNDYLHPSSYSDLPSHHWSTPDLHTTMMYYNH